MKTTGGTSEQSFEWFTKFGLKPHFSGALVVLDDEHLRKERLVEHPLDVLWGIPIGSTTVDCQV
jgi:hypothetical protein